MTMRTHLKEMHARLGEHAVSMAKVFQKMRGMMGKAEGTALGDLTEIQPLLGAMADEFTALGEYHLQCCKDLDAAAKAAEDDLDKIVPDHFRRVTPTMTTPIPRNGAPALNKGGMDVPAEFANLVQVEDEGE